jgi:hypothetical protein
MTLFLCSLAVYAVIVAVDLKKLIKSKDKNGIVLFSVLLVAGLVFTAVVNLRLKFFYFMEEIDDFFIDVLHLSWPVK